jgi:hypothetical protein
MINLASSTEASDDSSIEAELASSGWSYAIEPVGITKENALTKPGLMEQINTTADASDFLWYSTRYRIAHLALISVHMVTSKLVVTNLLTNFYFVQRRR